MTRYTMGVSFEYLVRDYLKAQGYSCVRSAGSKGAVDLVCWSPDEILFCQCKKESSKRTYQRDKQKLLSLPIPANGKLLLWIKRGQNVIVHTIGTGKVCELDIKKMRSVASP